ncbi:MAG TPA: hypothetical protein VFD09_03885 [Thiopseudomonas sp.]|nr:hypothetical protein [Thiopseudomonas sp.]
MVKIYKQPFAHDGDTIAIPNASQPDGKISNTEGWTSDYQLPKINPNYKPVGRREMNGVFKEVTEALGQVQVQGAATWSPDGAPFPINAQVYHDGKQWVALRANSVAPAEGEDWTEFRSLSLRENVKVTVGAGGDFPTINAAVLYLSRFTPDLGVTAEVELMSGFIMMEQLFVEGLNLGWITITGVDAETVINEPSLTRVLAEDYKPAFGVTSGTLPTIGQLFNFSSKGSPGDLRSGAFAYRSGRATILPGCGVKNAGSAGIAAVCGSTVNADSANASGAGDICFRADDGSTINARDANVSGAGTYGIRAFSGSTVSADSANASGAGTYGIMILQGSTINAFGATGTLSQAKNTVTRAGIIFQ